MTAPKTVNAQIYRFIGKEKPETTPLTIDNNSIRFFHDVLSDKCSFEIDEERIWWLTFFKGSIYEQVLCVGFKEDNTRKQHLYHKRYEALIKLAYYYVIDDDETDTAAAYNSDYIRGSKAIKYADHFALSLNSIHIDGRGLSFIASMETQYSQFERYILLLALTQAYRIVIEQLSTELALINDITNDKKLDELYLKVAEFNAIYFLSRPVKSSRTNVSEIWDIVSEKLLLEKISSELCNQISSLHYIISAKQQKEMKQIEMQSNDIREQRNEIINKWGLRLAIIGVGITLVDLFFNLFVK
ncbi:MAG: hypothetical protein KGV56_00600 [Gammaproteobacteria bacterium]|nr:hypothetical protein [Gammaproteobacteria bacterium]